MIEALGDWRIWKGAGEWFAQGDMGVLPRFVVAISKEAGQHHGWGTGTEQARLGLKERGV